MCRTRTNYGSYHTTTVRPIRGRSTTAARNCNGRPALVAGIRRKDNLPPRCSPVHRHDSEEFKSPPLVVNRESDVEGMALTVNTEGDLPVLAPDVRAIPAPLFPTCCRADREFQELGPDLL